MLLCAKKIRRAYPLCAVVGGGKKMVRVQKMVGRGKSGNALLMGFCAMVKIKSGRENLCAVPGKGWWVGRGRK